MAPRRKPAAPTYAQLFGDGSGTSSSGTSSSDAVPDSQTSQRGRIVGIGSVNEVARATSSYTSRWDEETAQMKARMDSQQVRLDSLEDLLDVMAVGNPVMQRMLSERRAALGMPPRDPQESDPTRQQPSNPTNYFDNMNIFRRKRNESFTTKPLLRRTFNNETSFDVNSS
uniref:Uncharacterized protein n=1 Tax=Brassica oleracea var. oleracea TaxID=109376 RepID=A0A0D3EB22_BRAOL